MASTFVWILYFASKSEARASSLDLVRETRRMLKPRAASWEAYSLPMPSEAPVTTAQLPFWPNFESCEGVYCQFLGEKDSCEGFSPKCRAE